MGVVNPLTKEQAAPEVHEAFDKLAAHAGKVPSRRYEGADANVTLVSWT